MISLKFNTTFDLRCRYHNGVSLFFVSLLFVVLLFTSCFVFIFSGVSPFVSGTPDKVVKNETELRDAVSSAVGSVVIALGNDITLTEPLIISTNKDVTLMSNSNSELFKLMRGIIVEDGGVLKLDGIIVTDYADDMAGVCVSVNSGGTFVMYSGELSGNARGARGVSNAGTFEMFGGVISGNRGIAGGGVSNLGTFTMFGGKISNNYAHWGGGVANRGNFSMSGGLISNNTAFNGGGVHIYGNIFNSSIIIEIYPKYGVFDLLGGEISGNTARGDGGGVWVGEDNFGGLFVSDGVVFSNNRASAVYDRDPIFDYIYNSQIGRNVVWSSPFTQGYNNYDISFVYGTSITQYTVTVRDSYQDPSTGFGTGAGSYSVGAAVTVFAGTRDGYTFSGWTVNEGGVTLSNSVLQITSFTMPANNVVVTANWRSHSGDGPLPTNSTSTPTPSDPVPSGSVPDSPMPSSSASGGATVSPSSSDNGNLLSEYFGYIVLVVCVVLVVIGVIGVLLRKRSKT